MNCHAVPSRAVTFAAPLLALVLVLAGGCADTGRAELSLRSVADQQVQLTGSFQTGIYSFDDVNHGTLILLDGPADKPTQVLVVRTLWTPRPAYTPIAATATNAEFTYVIFAGSPAREAGIYTGYGFLFPSNTLGDDTFSASIWDSTMELTDASPRFVDPLGQAILTGDLRARRDDLLTRQLLRRISVMVSRRLQYHRVVDAGAGPALAESPSVREIPNEPRTSASGAVPAENRSLTVAAR
jgi:hypothetical protein